MNTLFELLPTPPVFCDACKVNIYYPKYGLPCKQSCSSKFRTWSLEYEKIYSQYEQALSSTNVDRLKRELSGKHALKSSIFFTVRPPADCEFAQFRKDAESLIKMLTTYTTGYLVYEQKGTDINSLGQGFHIHGIVDKFEKPSYFLQRLQRKFKYVAKQCIDVTIINNEEVLLRHHDYLAGKKDKSKMDSAMMDKPFRERFGLPDKCAIGQ